MKVIDFQRKGNIVRLFLGKDDLKDWGGDDWNDAPYEHNAGGVYPEYITGYLDFAVPFNGIVLEPADGMCNSPWSKDDMKNGKCPMLIILLENDGAIWDEDFSCVLANRKTKKIYMGDPVEKVKELLNKIAFGGVVEEQDGGENGT